MAFTRDELKKYEEQPATAVDDKINPFTQSDATEQTTASAAEDSPEGATDDTTADVETPSSDAETETPADDSVDGTSDANDATADSSTADTADSSGDSDDTHADDGAHSEPAPKKGSARERIQELVDERDSYRAYGEFAQDQLKAKDQVISELSTKLHTTAKTNAATVEQDDPIPTLEDADVQYDPQRLNKKLVAWRDKIKAKATAAATSAQVNPDAKAAIDGFLGRVQKFTGEHKDFDETVKLLPQFAPDASAVIVKSEIGPDILYYLGKRKADAVRIARLPIAEQLLELGAIRDKVKAIATKKNPVLPPKDSKTPAQGASQTPAKPKSTSNAPPPPTAVRGGGRRDARDITDPNVSMDEFVKRHRAEKHARFTESRKLRGLR